MAQWAILIFVGSMALEQLKIGGQVLVSAFQIASGAFCLVHGPRLRAGRAAQILEKLWKG